MTGEHVLRADSSIASFDLADGARLTRLMLGGHDLLVTNSGQEAMWWGAFVMAPWTSLLRDPSPLGGEEARREILAGGPQSDWHGVARRQAWELTADGGFTAALGLGWPFGGTVAMLPRLAPNRFELELVITPGPNGMPAALGWHPWFVRSLDGAAVDVVVPQGSEVQERDASDAPTGRWVPPTRRWNDCVRSPGPVRLVYPGVGSLEIAYSSDYVTLFTTHPQGVCVEPVTGPAERLDDVLAPGESLRLDIRADWISAVPPVAGLDRSDRGHAASTAAP